MIDLQRYLAEQFVRLYEFLTAAFGQRAALRDRALQLARRDYLAARQAAIAYPSALPIAA